MSNIITILEAALKRGKTAKGYRFGDTGPDYYDCSGLMYRATQDAGVYKGDRFTTFTVGHSSAFERIISPKIDDLVVWSENSAHGHMGVISGPDTFYSARSVADGLGYLHISTFHVYPVKPFYLRPVKSDGYTRSLFVTTPLMYGDDVRTVQRIIGAVVDGFYGSATQSAVRVYQADRKLVTDGIVGPLTQAAMDLK